MVHGIPQHIVVCRGRYVNYGRGGQKFIEKWIFLEK
jgi:hypothetical protein